MERILTTDNTAKWTEIIESMPRKDVFDTVEYTTLFEKCLNLRGELFYYETEQGSIAHIFFKKKINDLDFLKKEKLFDGKEFFDLVSPWYWGGYLFNLKPGTTGKELLSSFSPVFKKFCLEKNIVTEFIRLHPLSLYDFPLNDFSNFMYLKKFNDVVYIDLTQDEDCIWKNMKDSNREKIKKAKRNSVMIDYTNNETDIEGFHKLYIDSMKHKNAKSYYFFPFNFLKGIVESFPEDSILIIARYKEKLIGGIITLGKYDYAYSYLSTSIPELSSLGTNNILKYEGIMWAKQKGYRYFVLGGGNSINDSLFKFKASFSNTYKDYYIGRVIYNQRLYDLFSELKIKDEVKNGKTAPSGEDFFPRYRLEI